MDKLNHWIFNYNKKRQPERKVVFPNYSKVRSVVLVYEQGVDDKGISLLAKRLEKDGIMVEVVGYQPKEDFNYFGRVKAEAMTALPSQRFDLLMDLSTHYYFGTQYILMAIDATFKAGLRFVDVAEKDQQGILDMMVSLPGSAQPEEQIIQGLGTALVTPFTETGKVDETALHRLLDRQLAAKVDFLVVLGTTGEAATMTAREQAFVRKTIVEHVAGRVPLVLGVGGNCTQEVVERLGMLSTELKRDYAAILSVCPYYNKPQQEGLYRHFAAIAEASAVPVILYNVPGRTGVNMLPETVFRLAASYPHKIIGVKEASGKQEQIEAIIRGTRGSEFVVLSGDDGLAAPLMLNGAQGLISVLSNALPEDTMRLVHQPTLEQQAALDELIKALFAEGNPTGIKGLLSIQGVTSDHVRLPLIAASAGLKSDLRKLLDNYENSTIR